MAGQVEQDHAFLAFDLGVQRLVNRAADGVRRFRRGEDAFRACKLNGSLEGGFLLDGYGFDQAGVIERA